ncbi:MAG: hypothetical protein RI924_330, partial [Bacteroidota bacterium]
MRKICFFCTIFLLSLAPVLAQQRTLPGSTSQTNRPAQTLSLDSLRKKEESRRDSVVPGPNNIRYTNLAMLKDSVFTLQLDTALKDFHHYNLLNLPQRPTINLGGTGLAYRDLLFDPTRSIGFQAGFHALDRYVLRSDSVRYYIARSPYTELYYVSGQAQEQIFRVTHTQNVKPNWNVGVNYNRIGGDGFYKNQNPDHLNAAIFTWYRSLNSRYQLMAHALFNNLKAGENGSTVREDLFEGDQLFSKDAEFVRLSATGENRPRQTWRENTVFLKQTFDIGRRDTLSSDTATSLLPTQRVAYTLSYTKNRFRFFRNEPDTYNVFPHPQPETTSLTNDTTEIAHLHNAFDYSFYIRSRSVGFLRNELKVDLGAVYDRYQFLQTGEEKQFNNTSLRAGLSYRFNERVNLNAKFLQIAQGSQAGDYLYEARSMFLLSKSLGSITLGAYLQNKSPEYIFNRINYQFHQWNNDFKRSQIRNLNVLYENPAERISLKAEYFNIENYLYFGETATPNQIAPVQSGSALQLLKLSLSKHFKLAWLNLEHLSVYQKSDDLSLLRTPEFYTFNSLYV